MGSTVSLALRRAGSTSIGRGIWPPRMTGSNLSINASTKPRRGAISSLDYQNRQGFQLGLMLLPPRLLLICRCPAANQAPGDESTGGVAERFKARVLKTR